MSNGRSIHVSNLGKSFSKTTILNNVDLDIQPGEFVTLLGASGCGKSTLLRLIAGFDTPDRGEIRIGDREVSGLAPKDRDVAMVFQSYALYPHMSVRSNISMPLVMGRMSFTQRLPLVSSLLSSSRTIRKQIREDVEKVAAQLELLPLLERKPAQLSGGQRQRVAVGRAMVRKPAVFLMDEPLSNLDAKLRVQLREEISDLHRRTGITFLYVTHDQTEAMTMSDRIALMEAGRVVQFGTPDQIYNAPAHLSVARFVGSVAINVITVRSRQGELLAGNLPLGLRAAGLADGEYQLGLRPEAFKAVNVNSGLAQFNLPVSKTEMFGSEIGLRCHGETLGTDWLRVQLPVNDYASLVAAGQITGTVALSLTPSGAHLFDMAGNRVNLDLMPTREAETIQAAGVRHVVGA